LTRENYMILSTHQLISNSIDDGLDAHLLNVNNRPFKNLSILPNNGYRVEKKGIIKGRSSAPSL